MIKKLMKSIREYKKDSLLSPAMVTLEVIMEVIIPMLMARLIDYGIQAQNLGYIWKMGILLAVTAMISLMFGVLSGKFAARASAGFAKNLRKTMYYKIQEFTFGNIDKFSSSGLVTRLTTDVTNVQYTFQIIIRIFVRAPLMIIFAVFIFFGATSVGVFILRKKMPDAHRPYKVWGYPFIPAFYILFCIVLFFNTIIARPREAAIGSVLILLGIPVFLYLQKKYPKTEID